MGGRGYNMGVGSSEVLPPQKKGGTTSFRGSFNSGT